MIIQSAPSPESNERPNPFLSTHAFIAGAGADISAWHLKRQARFQKNIYEAIEGKYSQMRATGARIFPEGASNKVRSQIKREITKEFNVARKSRLKFGTLDKYAKRYSKIGNAIGIAGAIAFGAEIGEGLFKIGTGYHSAQRARRIASAGAMNENTYYDTRAAATMRQRALQVIHNSQLSTRAAFGQEASYMHY